MRKLKLDSLTVESFETLAAPSFARGTVQGNDQSYPRLCEATNNFKCRTDSPEACGDTNYLDCTLACSDFASCTPC